MCISGMVKLPELIDRNRLNIRNIESHMMTQARGFGAPEMHIFDTVQHGSIEKKEQKK